jgi:hypothetical protein
MIADYNVQCDRSGQIFKRSECRTTWDNKLVAKKYWEPRHPQDILIAKADNQTVADARNEQADPLVSINFNDGMVI